MSVVVPVHDAEPFLLKTLRSILDQDHRRIEVLAIDDASSDRSWDILRSIRDPRLRARRNPRNRGIARTRNAGLDLARGRYLTFFDHDDVMLPGAISARVERLERDRRARLSFGFTKAVIGREGRVLKDISRGASRHQALALCRALRTLDLRALRHLLPVTFPMLTDLLMRRTLAEDAGRFRGRFLASDDCDYVCRLARLVPFHFVDVPVKLYRIHGRNRSRSDLGLVRAEVAAVTRRYAGRAGSD